MHAALIHLLKILNANGVTIKSSHKIIPIEEELLSYDDYMDNARGLATKTRSHYLRIIRRLLFKLFSDKALLISAIKPDDIRQFIAQQQLLYSTPSSTSVLVTTLRGYFHFRTTLGDQLTQLIGILCLPANWKLASLPKMLSKSEIKRLENALDCKGKTALRAKAIVHCALDLGLRCSEIANLRLDDID